MSTCGHEHPLTPKEPGLPFSCISKKGRQIGGSTALSGLDMTPELDLLLVLSSPFLTTKVHPLRSCVASLEWENLVKTKCESFPEERGIIMSVCCRLVCMAFKEQRAWKKGGVYVYSTPQPGLGVHPLLLLRNKLNVKVRASPAACMFLHSARSAYWAEHRSH